MFIAALFTVAKTWKQLTYPLTDDWVKKMRYIYTMEYYSPQKRWNTAIWGSMDRSWEYHTKRYKWDKKCQEPHDFIDRWDIKPHDFTHMRKATNEKNKKLTDSMMVTRKNKGSSNIWWWKENWPWVISTQCNIQKCITYRTLETYIILLANIIPINLIKKFL